MRAVSSSGGDALIRDMRVEDLDEVIALERLVFATPWPLQVFQNELNRGLNCMYLLIEAGGRLLGYIGAQLIGNEIHITNMAVEPSHRRRGLGSSLLLACTRRGIEMGARWLTLEVRESNQAARSFYRLFGFEEMEVRGDYYAETGENAVIMATGDIRSPEYERLMEGLECRLTSRGVE